jgi:hypothetical protein
LINKKGIWEEGKRIMWLEDRELIASIENGEIDFRSYMNIEENKHKQLISNLAHSFKKPDYLQEKLV